MVKPELSRDTGRPPADSDYLFKLHVGEYRTYPHLGSTPNVEHGHTLVGASGHPGRMLKAAGTERERREIGRRIALRRGELRLTQADLAAQIDISRSHLAKIETGDDSASLAVFSAIADALHISLDDLRSLSTEPDAVERRQWARAYDSLDPAFRRALIDQAAKIAPQNRK
jgi:transcriptional regulator with XRE-family HTH domain